MARRKKEKVAGWFDPNNPWPEGSVITFDKDSDLESATLAEVDLEYGTIILTGPEITGTFTFTAWNAEYSSQVEEVRFPDNKQESPPASTPASTPAPTPALTPASPPASSAKAAPRSDLVMVPIDQVDAGHNIRTGMNEEFIGQLTDSIRDLGMLEPLIIRKLSKAESNGGKRFRVVAGHQRLEAAARAGEEFVEAKVFSTVDDTWEAKARLAENVQRKNLNHMELAYAFGDASDIGLSVKQIAEQAHVSGDMVRRHLALRRLVKPVADLVATGFSGRLLPVHQAELISRVGDPARQISLAEKCLAIGWDSQKGTWHDRPHWAYREGDPKDFVMTMDDFRKEVAYAMCGLAACGWLKVEDQVAAHGDSDNPSDLKTETPISDAGGIAGKRPCAGCPDNTQTYADHPTLFAGIRPQGSDKKGYCTNRPCYEAKVKAWDKVKATRAKAKEKKIQRAIAKAKKAGLDVCEICGKVADAGETFDKCKEAADAKLCTKCAAKAVKQANIYSNNNWQQRNKEKKKLEAKFPWTDEQRHALALWAWGKQAAEAIGDWLESCDSRKQRGAAVLICRAIGIRMALADQQYDCSVTFGEQLESVPQFNEADKDNTATALATMWREVTGVSEPEYGQPQWHEFEPGINHEAEVYNVPLPPEALALLDLFEQIAKQRKLFDKELPLRPVPTATVITTE